MDIALKEKHRESEPLWNNLGVILSFDDPI